MDEAQVERVARAMCVTDGRDPDSSLGGDVTVGMTAGEIARKCGGETIPLVYVLCPAWRHYRPAAIAWLAAYSAMAAPPQEPTDGH